MVKHIYLTLAALLIMALAVSSAPTNMEHEVEAVKDSDLVVLRKTRAESSSVESDEEADDDDDDDEAEQKNDSAADDDEEEDDDDDDASFIRRRREAAAEPAKETAEAEAAPEAPAAPVEEHNAVVDPSASEVPTTTRKPVLVLIRDALNKVTTGLPTEQVTNNALQYFQLFQHFIQQTIEQVIDAADDDEDEVSPATTVDEDKKEEEDKKQEEDKVTEVPEKQTEEAAVVAEVPAPVPTDNETKPAKPAGASNAV
ncbi:trigger factor [Drosophila sulfurigaster albostrigata]|uniref:trigger factor n=1 Tax=Drosophila sulfurigaster albostrigata TaxID=89887 RepID=UPI002D21A692|nr:trigger factor [Drosophila sulfurigaster albostrigata]